MLIHRGRSPQFQGLGSLIDQLPGKITAAAAAATAQTSIGIEGPIYPGAGRQFFTLDEFKALAVRNAFATAEEDQILATGLLPSLATCTSGAACAGGYAAPSIWAPGTFQIAFVPFHFAEIKDGRYDRTYTPSPRQRFWAERYVVLASQKAASKRFAEYILNPKNGGVMLAGGPSIGQLHNAIGVRTYWPNMALNPIQATADEYNKPGGYAKWIKRGGYPLMLEVLEGRYKASDEAITPIVCANMPCACPTSDPTRPWWGVACEKVTITSKGEMCPATQCRDAAGFWPYIKIDEAAGGKFHMALIYDKPSKLTRVGEAMAALFQKMASLFCTAQPAVASQMSTMSSEKCVNTKTHKPCTKGSKDCKCVTPPAENAAAIGMFNYAASQWCTGWNKENAVPPPPSPPVIPQPAVPANYWPWIIGGAAVVGGLWYARNR